VIECARERRESKRGRGQKGETDRQIGSEREIDKDKERHRDRKREKRESDSKRERAAEG
jgi:hypothetical protein